jgi:hypothetical protein
VSRRPGVIIEPRPGHSRHRPCVNSSHRANFRSAASERLPLDRRTGGSLPGRDGSTSGVRISSPPHFPSDGWLVSAEKYSFLIQINDTSRPACDLPSCRLGSPTRRCVVGDGPKVAPSFGLSLIRPGAASRCSVGHDDFRHGHAEGGCTSTITTSPRATGRLLT